MLKYCLRGKSLRLKTDNIADSMALIANGSADLSNRIDEVNTG